MFASNAIVPVATMPGWLQGFARNQPFSVTVSAVRALMEGGAAAQWVWQSPPWAAGMFAVFFTISILAVPKRDRLSYRSQSWSAIMPEYGWKW
jgi:ABC-2 type transport system permease protein/oleandomycin transport system permease protein